MNELVVDVRDDATRNESRAHDSPDLCEFIDFLTFWLRSFGSDSIAAMQVLHVQLQQCERHVYCYRLSCQVLNFILGIFSIF